MFYVQFLSEFIPLQPCLGLMTIRPKLLGNCDEIPQGCRPIGLSNSFTNLQNSKKWILQRYWSMLLEPIEVMDDRYEFKKLINSYFDDTTKQLMQGFELMASQLRGKFPSWRDT